MQSFGVLNNFIMLELRWYNDEIVFNHDCYCKKSMEIDGIV